MSISRSFHVSWQHQRSFWRYMVKITFNIVYGVVMMQPWNTFCCNVLIPDIFILLSALKLKLLPFLMKYGFLVIWMLNSTPSFGLPTFVSISVTLWPARALSWKYKSNLLMSAIDMLLFTLFLTAFCRMETMWIPLHIDSIQCFDLDSALSATKQMLPDRCFETTPTMWGPCSCV